MKHLRPRWVAVPLALTLSLPVLVGTSPASAADADGGYIGYVADNGGRSTYVVVRSDGTPYWDSPWDNVIAGAIGHVTSTRPTIVYVDEVETATSYVDRLHVANEHGDQIVYSAQPGVDLSEPVVSPDGNTVLFVLDSDTTSTLAKVDANTREARALLTSSSTLYAGPSFSPDGSWISYAQELPTNPPTDQIVLAPLAGGASTVVAQTQSGTLGYVDTAWSPDGATLMAVRVEQANGAGQLISSLERFDLRAGTSRVVLRGGASSDSFTSFGEPSWAPDSSATYATKVVETPADASLSLVRLPDVQGSFIDPVALPDYAGSVSVAGPAAAAEAADTTAPAPVTGIAGSLVAAATARVTFDLPSDPDLADVVVTRSAGEPADTPTATIEVGRTRSTSFDVPLPAPGTDYGISVFTRDWSGNLSPAAKVVVRTPEASTVSVSTPPAKVAYRTAVRLTGKVVSAGKPVTGKVTLYARRAMTSTAVAVTSATLAADGSYALAYTPQWTAEYQVRFAGSPTGWAADSAKKVVAVVPLVSLATSTTRTTVGRTVTLAGGVAPAHGSQVVDVQRYVGNGAWRTIATTRLSSTSQYKYALKPGSRGTWTLRVVKRADADHLLAVSPTRSLSVS